VRRPGAEDPHRRERKFYKSKRLFMSKGVRRRGVLCCLDHVASLRAGDEVLDAELAISILVSTAQDCLYLFPAAGNIMNLSGGNGLGLLGKFSSNPLGCCLVAPFIGGAAEGPGD
jgi:hypothetical protein